MAKTIYWVYQDCPMCGQKKKWAEQQLEIADARGFEIIKTSFATEKGRKLIWQALTEHKIKGLPFFTDGKKFSKKMEDFTPNKRKSTKRKKKVNGDGDSE